MDQRFTETQIRQVAKLARLHLDDEQIELYRNQLVDVLEHVRKLSELDLEGVEPLAHPIDLTGRLAHDEPQAGLSQNAVFSNAPLVEGPYIAVPKVLGNTRSG